MTMVKNTEEKINNIDKCSNKRYFAVPVLELGIINQIRDVKISSDELKKMRDHWIEISKNIITHKIRLYWRNISADSLYENMLAILSDIIYMI